MCVEKFLCDGKVGSLKKKFGTKQGLRLCCLRLCLVPEIGGKFGESS